MLVINNLNDFLVKYKKHIDTRTNESWANVKAGRTNENLGEKTSYENVRNGVIGEILYAVLYKGRLTDGLFTKYDVIIEETFYNFLEHPSAPNFEYKKELNIDIKTLNTKADLKNTDFIQKCYSVYIQADQVKSEVLYSPVLINKEKGQALLYEKRISGRDIIKFIKPVYQNPPNTRLKEIKLNHIVPHNLFK